MGLLDNIFVKKAIKSLMSPEQYSAVQKFTTAIENGEIDKGKLARVSNKVSKLSSSEINSLLDLIDKNLK